jgi:hypothetical protein
MKRYAAPSLIAGLYLMLLFGLWGSLASSIVTHLSAERVSEAAANLNLYGHQFIYLNAVAFTAGVLWVARTKSLSPASRYLVPTILAVGLTFVVAVMSLLLVRAIPGPGPLAFSSMGSLIYWADCVAPGLLAAQLFRFPRSDRYPMNSVVIQAAPSNTR